MEDSLMNSPSRTLRSMLRGLQEVITPTDTPELLRDAKDNNLHLGSLAEGDSNFHSSRTKDPSNIGQNDLTYGNLSLMNETDVSDDTLSKLSLRNIRMKLRSRKHAPSTSDNVHLPPKTPDVSTTSDQTYGHNVFTFDSTDDSIRQEKLEEFVRTKRRRKVKTENLELPNKTPDISIGKDQTYAHTSMSDSSDDTIQYEEAEELVRKRRKRKIDSAEDVDINYNISNLPKWNDVSSGSKSLGSESKRTRGLKSTSSALPEITVSHIQDSSTIHSDDTSLGSEDQIKTMFSKARKSIKLDLAHIIEKIDDKKDSNDSNQGQPVSSNTTVETPRKSPRTRSSFQTSASLINNLSIPRSTRNLTSSTTLDRYVEVETLASPTMVPSKLLQKSPPRTNLSTYIEPKQSPKSVTIAPPSSPSLAPSTPGLHPDDNLSTSSISSMTESFESVVNPGIKSQLNRKRKSVKLDLDDIIAGMKTSQNSSERRAEKTPVDTACSQGTGVINQIDEENYESVSGRSEVVQTPKSKTLNNDSLEVSSAEDSVNYLKNKSLGDESEKSRRVSLKNTDAEKTPNKSSSRESSRNASMQESPANSLRNKSLRSVSLAKSPASSPRNKSLRNTDAEKTPTKSPSRESSRNASMQESPANSLRNKSLRNIDTEESPDKFSRKVLRNLSVEMSPANSPRSKSLKNTSLGDSPDNSPRSTSSENLPSSGASPDIASDDSPRRRSSKYLSPSELPDKNKSSASVSHSQKVISSREISSNQSSKNLSSADTQENLSFSKSKTDVVNPELRRRSSTPYSLRSTPRKNAAKYLDASFDKSTIKSPSKRALSPPTSPSRKLQSSPAASPNKITRLGDMNSPDKSGDILNNSRRSQRKSLNKSKATTDFPESVPEKSQILADSSNESSSTEMDVLPDKSQREIKESQFPSLNKSSGTSSLGSFLSSSNERGFPMEKDNQYERYSMVSPQRSEKLVESLLQQDSALPNTSVKQSRASPMPPNIDGTSASLQSPSKADGNKQKKSTEKSQISLNASKNISRKEVTVLRNQSKIASEPKETGESQDQSSDVNDPSNKPKEATKQLSLKEFLERMSKGALPQQKEKPKTFLDLIQQPSIPSTSQTKTIKPPSRKPKVGKKTNSGNFPQKLNRNCFQHFSTRKVSNEAAIMFHDAMEVFLKNLSSDLEVIATAKKEKSISKNHIFILMKQLGLVSSWNEVYAKVQEFLPYEDWEKLIPTEYAFKRVLP